MTTADTLNLQTRRTSDDLRLRDVRTPPQEPTASPGPDKPIERPGNTRLVASWSAEARPTATWSVDPA